MKRLIPTVLVLGIFTLAGCEMTTTTAPSTDPTEPRETRSLTVLSPGEQDLTRNDTEEFTIWIERDNFAGPVEVELRNLPTGVSVVTADMTIPAGKNSLTVSVMTHGNAQLVNDHKVQVVARAKDQPDMKEAVINFDMDINSD